MLWTPCTNVKPRYESNPRIIKDHPLAKGLVGCWLVNEGAGGGVFDLTQYFTKGTLTNNPQWGGRGLLLYGVDAYVDFGKPTHLNLTSKGSIVIWSNLTVLPSAGYYPVVISNNNHANDRNGIDIAYKNGGFYTEICNTATRNVINYTFTESLNVWVCWVFTWGGGLKLYRNGKLVGSVSQTINAVSGTYPWRIGVGGSYNIADHPFFNGSIGTTCIYSRTIIYDEISSLYSAPYQFIESARPTFYSFGSNVSPQTLECGYSEATGAALDATRIAGSVILPTSISTAAGSVSSGTIIPGVSTQIGGLATASGTVSNGSVMVGVVTLNGGLDTASGESYDSSIISMVRFTLGLASTTGQALDGNSIAGEITRITGISVASALAYSGYTNKYKWPGLWLDDQTNSITTSVLNPFSLSENGTLQTVDYALNALNEGVLANVNTPMSAHKSGTIKVIKKRI